MAISSDALTLLFKASADTDDAKKGFADLRSEINKTTSEAGDTSGWQNLGKQIGLTDSQMAGLGKTLPMVGAGLAAAGTAITAVATAALALTKQLFDLSRSASEFGSEIWDAKEKTGLTAETLSAMKFAADQSGASLDDITSSTAKFAKLMGDAADGSEKAQDKLKALGVTSKDLDTALAEALKTIAEMPPGVEQMNAAIKAFGRSGADLLPFIKSFDGDLVGLTNKAKELGVTINDETAAAADEFGDQLDTLNAQLSGVGRTIGFAVMPQFQQLAATLSDWLAKNQGEIQSWGEKIAVTLRASIDGLRNLVTFIKENQTLIRIALGIATFGLSEGSFQAGRRIAEFVNQNYGGESGGTSSGGGAVSGGSGRNMTPGGSSTDTLEDGATRSIAAKLPKLGSMRKLVITSGNSQWDAWFNEMGARFNVDPNVLLLQSGQESSFNKNAVSPKGARGFSQFMPGTAKRFDVDTTSIKDSIRGQAQYMRKLLEMFGGDYRKALAGYNAGEGAVLKHGGIPPYKETRDYVSKIEGRYNSRVRGGDQYEYGSFDAEAEYQKELDAKIAAEKKVLDETLKLRRLEASLAIQILKKRIQDGEQLEEDAVKAIGQMRIEQLEEEQRILQGMTPTKETANRLAEIELELAEQRVKNEIELDDALQKRVQAEIDANWTLIEQQREKTALAERERDAVLQRFAAVNEDLRKKMENPSPERVPGSGDSPEGGWFFGGMLEGMGTSIEDMMKKVDPLKTLGNMVGSQFNMIAQAVGNATKAFVLFGNAGGSLKKFAAELLATLAQMAIVQAVWELAQGFAMLALSYFTGNAKYMASATQHFIAAAMFGAIGGMAAIAGRAVAGDSFKNEAAGGYGSAGQGGGNRRERNPEDQGRAYSSNEEVIVEGDRNRPLVPQTQVAITFAERSGGFADWFDVQIRQNGKLRNTLRDVAADA